MRHSPRLAHRRGSQRRIAVLSFRMLPHTAAMLSRLGRSRGGRFSAIYKNSLRGTSKHLRLSRYRCEPPLATRCHSMPRHTFLPTKHSEPIPRTLATTVAHFPMTASLTCPCSFLWQVYPLLTTAFTLDIHPRTSALVTYEYISTFQEEAELYWRQKFRISTAVFLANRYLGLIFFGFLEYIPLRPDLLVCDFMDI